MAIYVGTGTYDFAGARHNTSSVYCMHNIYVYSRSTEMSYKYTSKSIMKYTMCTIILYVSAQHGQLKFWRDKINLKDMLWKCYVN